MSFYASSPTPTSDPVSSARPPTAWPSPLDQIILQQAQSSQMGALRRHASALPDTLSSELPNYSPAIDSDRLFLETMENQVAPGNGTRQLTPNYSDPSNQQTAINSYRQTWESPGMGINGCNVANLPQAAYRMANDLSLDSAPLEDFASSVKHAEPVREGLCVQRLMKFHTAQQRDHPDRTLDNFWKPLFASYFAPDATMHIDIRSENTKEVCSIKIPVEALPRIWKSKFDAGVTEERLLMENPKEHLFMNGHAVVDCEKTVILTKYEQSTVITNGHLRVHFYRDKKIMSWRFSPDNHQELLLRSTLGLGVPPPSAICEYGMPLSIMRLMVIAADVGGMSAKIDAEVSRILSQSSRAPPQQTQHRVQEQKLMSNYAGCSKGEGDGNAFCAILSGLDGFQGISVDEALGDTPVGNATIGPGGSTAAAIQGLANTVVQGLQRGPGVDGKQSIENGDPSSSIARESVASWRTDHPSDVYSNIFEDPLATSLPSTDIDGVSRPLVRIGNDLHSKRQTASNLVDNQEPQGGHSVVDAVAAAANGQGGWGIGSTAGRHFAVNGPPGDDMDPSLQLLSTVPTDGGVNLQPGGEGIGSNTIGHNAPPGLSDFTPHAEQLGKNGKTLSGRRRSQNSAMREVRTSSSRPVRTGNPKIYNDVRSFQRMPSNTLKRSNLTTAVQNVNGVSNVQGAIGVSQGVTTQNTGISTKAVPSGNGSKSAKDHAQGMAGVRRNSQRNSTSDGREKRQKTSQASNQT